MASKKSRDPTPSRAADKAKKHEESQPGWDDVDEASWEILSRQRSAVVDRATFVRDFRKNSQPRPTPNQDR